MGEKELNEIGRAVADDSHHGMRLDRFLLEMLPDSGLRQRRRLIENGFIQVNGRKCRSGLKISGGMEVVLFEARERACADEIFCLLKVVKEDDCYAAVFKPQGIHSASIAGSPEPSVEECLPGLFPGKDPILANRLDKLTSGMLLVAFGVEQENMFREYEDRNEVDKFYYAKVRGVPESGLVIKNRLDTADRNCTRVQEEQGPPERWSSAEVVETFADGNSLLSVRIAKGARHQIRAHLAHEGFPIIGDPVYGNGNEDSRMYLHHRRILFPGFEAVCEPEW